MLYIKSILDKVLGALCAILLAFMTFLTTYQVFMRYVVHNPSTVSEDLLGFSFVWVSLLGTALVFGQGDHIKITIISDKLTGLGELILNIITELLIMLIAIGVFIVGGKYLMDVGAVQISPTLNIQMHWIYVILPLSGFLIVFYNIVNVITEIQTYKRSDREARQ